MKEHIVRFFKRIPYLFAELGGGLLTILAVVMVADCISRGVGKSVPQLGAIAVFVFIAVVYLGMPWCEERKSHVRVEALISRLPSKLHYVVSLFDYFLALLTLAIVVYGLGQYLVYAHRTKEAVASTVPLHIYPVIFIMLLCVVLYWLQLFFNTVEELKKPGLRTCYFCKCIQGGGK